MAIIRRAMPSAMVLPIQHQRLRDLWRRDLCRTRGGVEEFGEFRHGGGEGSAARTTVFVEAKGVRKARDRSYISVLAPESALR